MSNAPSPTGNVRGPTTLPLTLWEMPKLCHTMAAPSTRKKNPPQRSNVLFIVFPPVRQSAMPSTFSTE